MELRVYQYDPAFVLERFRAGECAYVDGVSEVEETQFFRYIGAQRILAKLAGSYPSPRQKQEVPTWMYLASNLSMRLHGVHSFQRYPYVVRCGGMLNAFGPEVAHKAEHPETQDVTLRCAGFNHKNTYDRQTPCDQDFLRKLARDTPPERLQAWFNQEVLQVLQQHQAFDPDGIFLGDASYLFVPDNEHYEGSVRLLFDEHDPPGRAEGADRGAARTLSVAAVRQARLARPHQPAGGLLSVHRRGGRLRQGARMSRPVPTGGGLCGCRGARGDEAADRGSRVSGRRTDRPV